jgi:DNA-binding MarR family transcriptional regulator
VQIFEDFFRTLARHGLKPGEFSVLWVLSLNPGQKQGSIARRLRIKPPHMTKVIQRLESGGYLIRTIPDDDRRSVRLRLTPKGAEFVAAHRAEFFAYFRRDRERLSEAELKALVALLRKYVRIEGAP